MKKKITVKRFAYSPATGRAAEPFSEHSFQINRPHLFARWRDEDGFLFGKNSPTKNGEHTHQFRDIVAVYIVEPLK